MDLMLIAAGAMTGLLVVPTGVGASAMMTTLLLLVFYLAPLKAVGTDLWFAAITKLFATRMHHDHGLIDWPVVLRLWLGSLTASALAAWPIFAPYRQPHHDGLIRRHFPSQSQSILGLNVSHRNPLQASH